MSKFWWVLGLPFTIMTQKSSPAIRTVILNMSGPSRYPSSSLRELGDE